MFTKSRYRLSAPYVVATAIARAFPAIFVNLALSFVKLALCFVNLALFQVLGAGRSGMQGSFLEFREVLLEFKEVSGEFRKVGGLGVGMD